ncbi:MAG: hypothetical protein ABIO70_09445 [Pseudomonadota bacterium]
MLTLLLVPLALADPLASASLPCSMAEDLIDIDGQGMRSEYWLTCRIPAEVAVTVQGLETPEVLTRAPSGAARLAAVAALYTAGRFPEVPPADRMRFALHLAVQEHEPFASTSVIFLDAADPGPDAPFRGRTGAAMGWMPWPWEPGMTPVIREFLQPGHVSTLACWYAQAMGDHLTEEARPDLARVVASAPESFEAELAGQALAHLDRAIALREGPFVAADRLGIAHRSGYGCVVVQVAGRPPTPGTSVFLVDGDRIQWTQVVQAPHCLDPGRQDQSALLVSDPWPEEGHTTASIVAPAAPPAPGADLDGDGRVDILTACATADGVRVTLAGLDGQLGPGVALPVAQRGLPPCGGGEH